MYFDKIQKTLLSEVFKYKYKKKPAVLYVL